MHKSVDNRRNVRITAAFCGYRVDREKLEMNSRRLLRDGGESSRNTFTVGNGNRPGVTPERGRYWETGTSRGNPGPAGGAWRQVYRATGEPSATQPGKAPSISYMEGALLHSARHRRFRQTDTPANADLPDAAERPAGPGGGARVS